MQKIALIGEFLPMGNQMSRLKKLGEVSIFNSPKNIKQLIQMAKDKDIIITHCNFNKKALSMLPITKLIVSWSTGLDNIDVDYANKNGIIVVNTPDYCSQSVAEYAIALLFCAERKILQSSQEVKMNSWDCLPYIGHELAGKIIGIIGYGNIGKKVSKIAEGLEMEVLINTKNKKLETTGIKFVDLITLLRKSDYIILCTSLNPSSEKLISTKQLIEMKSTVILINTSRGKIIDENALEKALKKNKQMFAALDVLTTEPKINKKLLKLPNVLITPHNAWNTQEALLRGAKQCVDHVEIFFKNRGLK
jgi:D-3-phosphoglycerate dehydrogenase / 2-oxoglutarate reductase